MTDTHPQELLCPNCDYDLRGQAVPRCPECGLAFESIEALVRASQHSWIVLDRTYYARQRIACWILIGFVIPLPLYWLAPLIGPWGLVFFIPLALASGFSLLLLLQVIRWRFARHVSAARRRQLKGSIPLLLFFSIPFLLLAPVLIALLIGALPL